jgi:hypothetical protein
VARTFRQWKRRIRSAHAALRGKAIGPVARGPALHNPILVGCHHKTGTKWLSGIFRAFSREFELRFHSGNQTDLPPDFDIYFESHSRFTQQTPNDYRGLHQIRDPRDLIVSAAFYHQTSDEAQLHVAREEFGGRTYQQTLCALPSLEEKINFEMTHSSGSNIRAMLEWSYDQPAFFEARYEDLIGDVDLLRFHEIFTFLGVAGWAIPSALRLAWQGSLFSGEVDRSPHIRSGAVGQWKEHFSPTNRRRFVDHFGDAAVRLGYEDDDDWTG